MKPYPRKLAEWVLLMYVVAIFLFPRLEGQIRVEDFLTPLLFLIGVLSIDKQIFNIALPGIIFFSYGFVVTLIAIFVGYLPAKVLLIWGKEVQYFIGFLVLLRIVSRQGFSSTYRNFVVFLCFFVGGTILYSIFMQQRGYYGLSYFNENSPSLSGWMFFNMFIFSLCLSNFFKVNKILSFIFVILFFIATLICGFRTGAVVIFSFTIIYNLQKIIRPANALIVIVAVGIAGTFYTFNREIVAYLSDISIIISSGLDRVSSLAATGVLKHSRYSSWMNIIMTWADGSVWSLLFGCGRGCTHLRIDGLPLALGMGGDNQYTVNLAELGLMGSGLFFLMIGWLTWHVRKPYRRFYIAYLIAYLMGSMTGEYFQLSKPGQLFWLVSATFIGMSINAKKYTMVDPKNATVG